MVVPFSSLTELPVFTMIRVEEAVGGGGGLGGGGGCGGGGLQGHTAG
jgi:hypothetical protein